jgi:hypothetical protein
VTAYFVGASAGFTNTVGLSVNGGPAAAFGLNNKTSAYGLAFDMGPVTAGDSLVFVMRNVAPGLGLVYSDPALNGPYDGVAGHKHVYATPFAAAGAVPSGTLVAFEDLPLTRRPDWDYNDIEFVVTNVTATAVPEPATITALGIGLGCLGARAWRRQAVANGRR